MNAGTTNPPSKRIRSVNLIIVSILDFAFSVLIVLSVYIASQSYPQFQGLNSTSDYALIRNMLLFKYVPLALDFVNLSHYGLLTISVVGIAVAFVGLGRSLLERKEWSYQTQVVLYAIGSIFFFLVQITHRPDYDVGFVVCLSALALLIADHAVPRFAPRFSNRAWLVLIPAVAIGIIMSLINTNHNAPVESIPQGFTRDGKQVVYSAGNAVYAVTLDTMSDRLLLTEPDLPPILAFSRKSLNTIPVASPDGKWIAYFVSSNGKIVTGVNVSSTDSSGPITTTALLDTSLNNENNGDGNINWSPDSTRFTFIQIVTESLGGGAVGINPHLMVINRDGTGLVDLVPQVTIDAVSGNWSPDGKLILTQLRDGLYQINPDTKQSQRLTVNEPYAGEIVWTPDMTHIAFSSLILLQNNSTNTVIIRLMNADGTQERTIDNGRNPQWAADGRTLYYLSDPLRYDNDNLQTVQSDNLMAVNVNAGNNNLASVLIPGIRSRSFTLAPDSKTMAYEHDNGLCIRVIGSTDDHCFPPHRQ